MKNILKEKISKGEPVIGTFCGLAHPLASEILCRLGFDWLVIDGEHAPAGWESMMHVMQAMNGSTCTPFVRPQWNDPVTIKRALDVGAHGLLVPWVNTKEEAELVVSACTYPPKGIRGCGPFRPIQFDPEYLKTADEEIYIIVQIETPQAIKNLDDILSVERIDACYVGPMDMAMNLGIGGPNWDDPKYIECFETVVKIAKKHGKPAGMFVGATSRLSWAMEKGFTLNTVGSDDHFMVEGAKIALDIFRSNS